MKKLTRFSALLLALLISATVFSNNINVQNVSLEDQVAAEHYVFIEFDLSWDNSWRTTSVPNNWDAAWVFCKYRLSGGEWQHVYIHDTNHYVPYSAVIDVAPDTTGAFIYRAYNGSGTNNWSNIRLRWDYGYQGINDDAALEVKVFAIEMVYIPEGDYYLGDTLSNTYFHSGGDQGSFFHVTSEDPIQVGTSPGYLTCWGGMGTGTLAASFPKGYGDFYIMKYEISQEQYIDFLNMLTRTQQDARTKVDISVGVTSLTSNYFLMTGVNYAWSRNGIRCDANIPATGPVNVYADLDNDGIPNEAADGQNIACNNLGWDDLAAYLDWSGLRPMSELEYEKACRGPNNPVGGEYAWGNTMIFSGPYSFVNDGQANEAIDNLPENTGNCIYNATQPNGGEVFRCGIFAASSVNHSRVETGATYYGVMEMSGNANELCNEIYSVAGRSFTGQHGDGNLLASGDADVDYWPGINGNDNISIANTAYATSGVTGTAGAGLRGGTLNFQTDGLQISSRSSIFMASIQHFAHNGGRGVRTAP
jgi:formylglycine-generating enzyme required for sulfatase activity